MSKIKSIQIQNQHNNGKLYEVGKSGITEIINNSLELENTIEFIYDVKAEHELIATIINCPVLIEFKNSITKPVQKELFKESTQKFNFKKSLIEIGVSEQVASDWLKVRSKKKAADTKTAYEAIEKQIKITTHKPDDCIKVAVKKNWIGFEAEWYFNAIKQPINNNSLSDMNKL